MANEGVNNAFASVEGGIGHEFVENDTARTALSHGLSYAKATGERNAAIRTMHTAFNHLERTDENSRIVSNAVMNSMTYGRAVRYARENGTLEAEEIAKFCEQLRPSKEMSAREVALAMAAMGAGDAGGHVTREQFETWWWTAGYRTLEERAEFVSAAGRADQRQSLHALFRTLPAYSCTCARSRPDARCVQMSSTRTPAAI